MKLEDYKRHLKTAFPEAVREAIDSPDKAYEINDRIKEAARIHHEQWGFSCVADCFDAAVPRSIRLQLEKWSMSEITVDHWKMDVSCCVFYLGGDHAHIQIRNTGYDNLPFTSTGFKSLFVPLATFQDGVTIEDYITSLFPVRAQMSLF